ncbi:PREDICTED: ciliary neurotrophic factor [Ficedula albicollis]|uniref:ciliary neurotrophic factor n=1 Tax=Ficedula albicollis TaxID=59894 RepID=UPI00035A2519|nr:PREDICTED: ciliary neurotrophic factor [Ficedula albicollis]
MAAADSPSAALRRRDLCSRGIRLAGKMRADVVDLLDAYVEQQGLDASASVAAMEGVPLAAVERWDEQTGTQRLLENLAAYRAFRALLAQMLEEQREQLGEADAGLGRALAAVLLQVSAFAYHLEELLRLESRGVPGEEGDGPPAPSAVSGCHTLLTFPGVGRDIWSVSLNLTTPPGGNRPLFSGSTGRVGGDLQIRGAGQGCNPILPHQRLAES